MTNATKKEFDELKEMLMKAAEKNEYDFRHPDVLEISRLLDKVIVEMMVSK